MEDRGFLNVLTFIGAAAAAGLIYLIVSAGLQTSEKVDAQRYIDCLDSVDGTDAECEWCYEKYNKGRWPSAMAAEFIAKGE